jgi:LacI family transcriptional regulator
MLAGDAPPSAVILGGNQLLEGALRVIHRRGLRLGIDLSLVCCDDVPLSRFHQPPIATVMRDPDLLGKRAAELLLGQLETPSAIEPVCLPTWFEPRASCGTWSEKIPTKTAAKVPGTRRRRVAASTDLVRE